MIHGVCSSACSSSISSSRGMDSFSGSDTGGYGHDGLVLLMIVVVVVVV